MAHYSIYPISDATIYSHPNRTYLNTGKDEILELVKERSNTNNTLYPSRVLLRFSPEEIVEAFNKTQGSPPEDWKNVVNFTVNAPVSLYPDSSSQYNANPNLFQVPRKFTSSLELISANHENIQGVQNISFLQLSESFEEGSGRYSNLPTGSDGVSWVYRGSSLLKNNWRTSSFATGDMPSTGSIQLIQQYSASSLTVGAITFRSTASINIHQISSESANSITIDGVTFVASLSGSDSSSLISTPTTVYYKQNTTFPGVNLFSAIGSAITSGSFNYIDNVSYSIPAGGDPHYHVNVSSSIGYNDLDGTLITTHSANGQNIYGLDTSSLGGGVSQSTLVNIGNNVALPEGGGSYYTKASVGTSQQIKPGDSLDINMNIAREIFPILRYYTVHSQIASPSIGSFDHAGFLLKLPDSVEANGSASLGNLQYFSVDTHTIYPPKLTFKWDDSTHTYQSQAKQKGDLNVSLYRNKKEYNIKDEVTFRVHVRDKYPTRQFASSSNHLNVGYFTTSSFYSVRDAHTEREILPWDYTNNKLSADSEGMYFKLYMTSFQPERYYRILFKHTNNEGTVTYDNDYYFKVIR